MCVHEWYRKLDAGSFVRANKIKANVEFSQALSDRYLKSSIDGYADKLLISELRDEMNAPFLELVGFEKVGQKQRYGILSLPLFYCLKLLTYF